MYEGAKQDLQYGINLRKEMRKEYKPITGIYADTETDSFQAMLVESCMHHVNSRVTFLQKRVEQTFKVYFFHITFFSHYISVHTKKDQERGWGGHFHTFLVLLST